MKVGRTCLRPVMRYHGGKWNLAPWIIGLMPAHRVYTEAFGGAASVLLQKPRAYAEVYNDLDGEIVATMRMVRDRGEELRRALYLTPFSRSEFRQAWSLACDDELEVARRVLIRACMGFGSAAATGARAHGRVMTGFRANSNLSGTTPAVDWKHYPDELVAVIERLRGVVIENKCALKVMQQHDCADALHYVDPPYPFQARTDGGHDYRHEMSDDDHRAMAGVLHSLKGKVMVSGYECPLYNELFGEWHVEKKATHADGASPRVECLWLNFKPEALLL